MNHLNKIQDDTMPTDDALIECYTTTLPSTITMFIKIEGKQTLAETKDGT